MRSVSGGRVAVFLLYLNGLVLEDGEVVGRGWSRAVLVFVIRRLTWRQVDDR
jgi:hypothetical protein